jgi:hypothetical protein
MRRRLRMSRRKGMGTLILLVSLTFFEYGCTSAQRKELLMEAAEATKKYVTENVLPEISKKATEIAEAKIKVEREKQYAVLDAQLAQLKVPKKNEDGTIAVDEDGKKILVAKTWKDFDTEDPRGELDSKELANLTGWIARETAQRVALGELSKDEAGRIAKNTGGAAVILALLLGAGKLTKKLGGKKNGNSNVATTGSSPTSTG